jgi:hypothetical protein
VNDEQEAAHRERWRAMMEQYQAEIGPLEQRLSAHIAHATLFGTSALRTVFELNGGGLIALPSLGALFGSIWSRGHWLPVWGVTAFVIGLICTALGYLTGFLHFVAWQQVVREEMGRRGSSITGQYNALISSQPIPAANMTRTPNEITYRQKVVTYQYLAIGAAFVALLAFIAGALITGYVLTGFSSAGNGGK